MALPCGHRRDPDQPEAARVGLVRADRCPICTFGGEPVGLRRLDEQCRSCFLSAGSCPCCGYHWVVHDDQARQVIAPVNHETGRSRP